MKYLHHFFFLAIFLATPLFAKPVKIVPKVIYGIDDRMDVFESSDNLMKELSKSTAVKIFNRNLLQKEDTFILKSETLEEEGICKSERFSQQPAAGDCSGFLVGPDLLVTAGHCIFSANDCSGHYWVFDYANTEEVKASFTFDRSQVYRCSEVIERKKMSPGADYALIRLERPVLGRKALKFRKEGKPSNDAVMTVLGHPSGLPLKITAAADMRNNSIEEFFVLTADTYGGNSGGAVVDSRTGIVEGILVRGATDYYITDEGCRASVVQNQNEGRGEDVTRITQIKALKRK